MRRLALRCAAGAAVLGLALTGCSEKQEASETLPSTSAEPTADALPPLGPDDLPMPDEARTQDAAGAEAFVRYYIELINRTSTVMDAQPLRDFSDGCEDCNRIAENIDEDAGAGLQYDGGQITVVALGQPLLTGQTAELALRVDQAELTVRDSAGASVPDQGSAAFDDLSGGTTLRWSDSDRAWTMIGLTLG
jgi:Family of unknown function (DUF6318)